MPLFASQTVISARGSGWVLLDYSDVVIHIFGPEEREYFALERLWAQAPQVVRIQ